MQWQDEPSEIVAVICSRGSEAALVIPAAFPRERLSVDACRRVLQASGVEVTSAVVDAIAAALAAGVAPGEAQRFVVARLTAPQDGEDGQVQWLVEDAGGAGNIGAAGDGPAGEEPEGEADSISFYECAAHTMVKAGQVIGRLIEPTPGTDGRDVTGRTLAAKPGRPARLRVHDSILCGAGGQLIAQIDGVLRRAADEASVSAVLEIADHVDFSSGNIDFDGDVLVRKDVRDRFVIKASRDVEVHGLIEAATIQCGGDLIARGGMAGRERGQVRIGRRLVARYLDNISGQVGVDLCVEREVINCELMVGNAVVMPGGAVIGGIMTVTGPAQIGELGSSAGTPTHLVFGSVPILEAGLRQLDALTLKLLARREKLVEEQEYLKSNCRYLSPAQKERMTELMFELRKMNDNVNRAKASREQLRSQIKQRRGVKFRILRRLHHGVRMSIRGEQYRIDQEVSGPLSVGVDPTGQPVYMREGSAARPLSQVARRVSSAGATAA